MKKLLFLCRPNVNVVVTTIICPLKTTVNLKTYASLKIGTRNGNAINGRALNASFTRNYVHLQGESLQFKAMSRQKIKMKYLICQVPVKELKRQE